MTPEHALIEGAVELIAHYVDPWVEKYLGDAMTRRELQSAKNKELFAPYFAAVVPRCSMTKTLLYRSAAVPLREFYVDLDLRAPDGSEIAANSVADLFDTQGPSLLITGGAGCGKSTLLKHLFLQIIEQKLGVPLFVELRHYTFSNGRLEDFLYETATNNGLLISRSLFDELLRHGRFVLFLDGFDEIPPEHARPFSMQLERFDGARQNLRTIVTSRPDYGYTFIGWHHFKQLEVLPLTLERCLQLIDRLAYADDAKAVFMKQVRDTLFETHRSFLQSPLLATLMLMMSQNFGTIQSRLGQFYAQAYLTLRSRHDAIKPGFTRTFHSSLDDEDFRAAVAAFTIQSYVTNTVSFSEERARIFAQHVSDLVTLPDYKADAFLRDLVTSVCLLIQDGLEHRFTHRTFQEYFTAVYILDHSGSNREALLWKLRERLNVDTTAQLLLELDRGVFEDEFLRRAVKALQDFLAWQPGDAVAACVVAVLQRVADVQITRTNVRIEIPGDEFSGCINTVIFIDREYYGETFRWFDMNTSGVDELRYRLIQVRSHAMAATNQIAAESAAKQLLAYDSLALEANDYDDAPLRESLTALLQPGIRSMARALSVFAQIDTERARRDRSGRAILELN